MGQSCGKAERSDANSRRGGAGSASDNISARLALGAGCYWGTEKYIRRNFQQSFPNSVKKAKVGFMNPDPKPTIQKPSYKQVCTGSTGHVEVLFVELADPKAHFEDLVRFFFTFHDPTTFNRQGNDTGTQYASYIFCSDQEQMEIAGKVKAELQGLINNGNVKKYTNRTVVTKIAQYTEFTQAEPAHQDYLSKHPNGYCNHYIRMKKWPSASKD